MCAKTTKLKFYAIINGISFFGYSLFTFLSFEFIARDHSYYGIHSMDTIKYMKKQCYIVYARNPLAGSKSMLFAASAAFSGKVFSTPSFVASSKAAFATTRYFLSSSSNMFLAFSSARSLDTFSSYMGDTKGAIS